MAATSPITTTTIQTTLHSIQMFIQLFRSEDGPYSISMYALCILQYPKISTLSTSHGISLIHVFLIIEMFRHFAPLCPFAELR